MKVVSLFSGAGGLDLGFAMAGHEIIWANDLYEDAVSTYRKNLGNHIVCEDIRNISAEDIPDCDIVIGGFPCQGFSVANTKRHVDDERNELYKQLIRIITAKRPKFFLAENVKAGNRAHSISGFHILKKGPCPFRILYEGPSPLTASGLSNLWAWPSRPYRFDSSY